jgi:hypothetical protein
LCVEYSFPPWLYVILLDFAHYRSNWCFPSRHMDMWACRCDVTIGSEICGIVSQRNAGADTASGTECKEELSILHVPVRLMMYCLQKHLLIGYACLLKHAILTVSTFSFLQ